MEAAVAARLEAELALRKSREEVVCVCVCVCVFMWTFMTACCYHQRPMFSRYAYVRMRALKGLARTTPASSHASPRPDEASRLRLY